MGHINGVTWAPTSKLISPQLPIHYKAIYRGPMTDNLLSDNWKLAIGLPNISFEATIPWDHGHWLGPAGQTFLRRSDFSADRSVFHSIYNWLGPTLYCKLNKLKK